MIQLHFEKLSRYHRNGEFVETALPFAAGALRDPSCVFIHDGKTKTRPQYTVTARWADGSVKWLHLSFLADLPPNAGKDMFLCTGEEESAARLPWGNALPRVCADMASRTVDTGVLRAALAGKGSSRLFDRLEGPGSFSGDEIEGPVLSSGGEDYTIKLKEDWRLLEEGPCRVILENSGRHYRKDGKSLFGFTVKLHFTAGHPWFALEYRFTQDEAAPVLPLEALTLRIRARDPLAETALGISNYKTEIIRGAPGASVEKLINAEYLVYESNEQIPETFYGTFFANWKTAGRGVCATIFQAQQNFPKALRADAEGLEISLMPRGQAALAIFQGVEKTHTVYLHFHRGQEPEEALNIRSLQFQLPDRPVPELSVYKNAGVLEDVFMDRLLPGLEGQLRTRADGTGRAYGMLHWGDAPDPGYTEQGRGLGKPVWTNNEYDYPHACMLMYARTGERRFMDKLLTAARHWMDIDICHHSEDPLLSGGQRTHSADHVSGEVVPSHEWVEGLLDYYHLTADRRALDLALGIGENILRLLETPMFQQKGEINARETGWALRSLCALHMETGNAGWLEKCEWIIGHFIEWKKEFGLWLSPYTDHTAIRVPFMIAVAVGSLMRYYRIRPSAVIQEMILAAVEDLLENARLPDGQFIYKELPSLRHVSANTIVLEALAYAWELSGDKKFLEGGLSLFRTVAGPLEAGTSNRPFSNRKHILDDAVLTGGNGTKAFAQSHMPLAVYARALEKAGMLARIPAL